MRTKSVTKTDLIVYRSLRTGKDIEARLSEEKRIAIAKEAGVSPSTVTKTLRKLEEMGVISGYGPVLTEKGKKLIEGLESVYFSETDGSEQVRGLQELI